MADAYTATGSGAVANPKTVGVLTTATTRRAQIDYFCLSCEGTPADNTLQWILQRTTAAGTTTSVTPRNKDTLGGDNSGVTFGSNATVEPTYTASTVLFQMGINARSTFQRQMAPGRELVTNLTSANGLGWKCAHASATPTVDVVEDWIE